MHISVMEKYDRLSSIKLHYLRINFCEKKMEWKYKFKEKREKCEISYG